MDAVFDLLLFSESFHYLDAAKTLRRIAVHAGKHVLIFDYFPRKDSATGRAVSHRQFTRLVADELAGTFSIASDRDMTGFIVPTFQVLDKIKNDYIRPFVQRSVKDFRSAHRVWALLLAYPLRRLIAGVEKPGNRFRTFPEAFEYRLIVLARR